VQSPLVIRTNSQFRKSYLKLKSGDVVVCTLNIKPFEEYIFTELIDRGVILFPSALSQLATRSKCFQARIFVKFMIPYTKVITDKKDLVMAMDEYSKRHIKPVITKLDRANCGLGINKWTDCESLFNHVTFSTRPLWPFVLQPFIKDALDIRVICIGDKHLEAYWRKNSSGFRNNLHFGGKSGPYKLSKNEMAFCKRVMERGKFPYAHIDLIKNQEGEIYLSEISLFGGTKGAKIDSLTCSRLRRRIEEDFLKTFTVQQGNKA